MNLGLRELADFLRAHQDDRALVLATVVATEGSSYRKPGAMMLVRENHQFAGLISGGCLEGDLVEHASAVFGDGRPRRITYDLSSDEDAILSLGLGCGGIVHLLLQRLEREEGFGFLPRLLDTVNERSTCILAVAHIESGNLPLGATAMADSQGRRSGDERLFGYLEQPARKWGSTGRYRYAGASPGGGPGPVLLVRVEPSPRVLICGAGPDAVPVARQVDALGWECLVVDHRGAYARPDRFPASAQVLKAWPKDLADSFDLGEVDAAVVMSHNLEHDATYLAQLGPLNLRYLGLLGPRARREELQDRLGITEGRVRGPAGLDIGAELPESVALSIIAEMHAVLSGATARA
jgi:xanthine/CO dehydrogenase XdhC/CoxF family maturation factor